MADVDGETGRPRRRRASGRAAPPLPDTPDPVDIAMEQVNAGAGGPAALLLENQNRLVEAQIHELHLKRLTRFLILAIILALLAAILALGVKASRSNALIVEPLQVPPALVQDGFTGDALAAHLLDRLSTIQSETESLRAAGSYSNNWGDNIRLAVPQTGVSVGELWRLMRDWLGNETRISGEVVRTAKGIAVTIRAGSTPGETFEGPEGSLPDLLMKASESAYRATQPYRFAVYLEKKGRTVEREALLLRLTDDVSPVERKWAFNGLGVTRRGQGKLREALEIYDRALAIDPHFVPALEGKALVWSLLARNEDALKFLRAAAAARRGDRSGQYDLRLNGLDKRVQDRDLASLTGDYAEAARLDKPEANSFDPVRRRRGNQSWAFFLAQNHDSSGAMAAARSIVATPETGFTENEAEFGKAWRRLVAAVAIGDSRAIKDAIPILRQTAAIVDEENARKDPIRPIARLRITWPKLAVAMAMTGDAAGAERLVASTPLDCYNCVRSRARVAALRGDREAARRWIAEAVRQGPSLPFAYSDWGELKLEAGDLKGAIASFEAAHRRGPRWADPLKYWGDALARQGDHAGAARKYAAAADRAPRWGALHVEWGKALWRTGRHEEARAKFRAAARMDLNADDRARLERIWGALRGRA